MTFDPPPSPERRRIMQAVRRSSTAPELAVRRALHRLGFRYRLNVKTLPGKPDIVLPKWRSVIFVHGCFWHGHDCRAGRLPRTRTDYWRAKVKRNRARDREQADALRATGWRVLTIWECKVRSLATDSARLARAVTGQGGGPDEGEPARVTRPG